LFTELEPLPNAFCLPQSPFFLVDVRRGDEEGLLRVMDRMILAKSLIHLWAYGTTWDACLAELQTDPALAIMVRRVLVCQVVLSVA